MILPKKLENGVGGWDTKNYVPCVGNAGTMVFFDTNTPHFAGHLYENSVRKVIRLDYKVAKFKIPKKLRPRPINVFLGKVRRASKEFANI